MQYFVKMNIFFRKKETLQVIKKTMNFYIRFYWLYLLPSSEITAIMATSVCSLLKILPLFAAGRGFACIS
jgi:hypothetical protein